MQQAMIGYGDVQERVMKSRIVHNVPQCKTDYQIWFWIYEFGPHIPTK
jgi:hypothetical protein